MSLTEEAVAAKTDDRKQIVAKIDPDLHGAIAQLARIEGLSLASYIERALRADLGNRREAATELLAMYETIIQVQKDLADQVDCKIDAASS